MRIEENGDSRITPGDEAEQKTPETKVSKRSADDSASQLQPSLVGNRHRRSPQFAFPSFQQPPNFPGQLPNQQFPMNPFQNPNFGSFSQQNANGNAIGQSQNPFSNQNVGANTQSSNIQNPFGNFQNTGGSGISSNLANNGLSGQLSAANTNQQSYLTALGAGQQNNAQGQSANFDPFGNLQTTAANAGNLQTIGADGIRNQANGAANAHNQNQFGTSDNGAQTMTETFEGPNGLSGQKASSSSHASQTNQYGNFPGNPAGFTVGNPGIGGFGMFPGFPQQALYGRARRSVGDALQNGNSRHTRDAVVFPEEEESDEKAPKASKGTTVLNAEMPEKDASNSTKSEGEEPDSLDSRFGLPGHPVRTFLRETLGGIFTGNPPQERGYGAYDNGMKIEIKSLSPYLCATINLDEYYRTKLSTSIAFVSTTLSTISSIRSARV